MQCKWFVHTGRASANNQTRNGRFGMFDFNCRGRIILVPTWKSNYFSKHSDWLKTEFLGDALKLLKVFSAVCLLVKLHDPSYSYESLEGVI